MISIIWLNHVFKDYLNQTKWIKQAWISTVNILYTMDGLSEQFNNYSLENAEVDNQPPLFNLHILIGLENLHPEQSHCKAFISRTRLQQGQVGTQRWRLSESCDLAQQTYG